MVSYKKKRVQVSGYHIQDFPTSIKQFCFSCLGDRICRLCPSKKVETEEHFLTECTFFNRYRPNYDLKNQDDAKNMILNTDPIVLGKYLTEAFSERKKYREWFSLD